MASRITAICSSVNRCRIKESPSRISPGCDCVDHVGIHLVMPGKHEALRNDRAYVVGAVCRIERPVAGNDLGLDVGLQFFGWFHRCKSNIFIRIARLTGGYCKKKRPTVSVDRFFSV